MESLIEKATKKKVFTLTKRKKLTADERALLIERHDLINGHDESVFENYMKHDGRDISLLEDLLEKKVKVEDAVRLCLQYSKSPAKEEKINWWLKKMLSLKDTGRSLVRPYIDHGDDYDKAFIYWLFVKNGRSGTSGHLQPFTDLEFQCLKTLVENGIISGDVRTLWFQPYCHVTTYEQLIWMLQHMQFNDMRDAGTSIDWECLFHHVDKRIAERAFEDALKCDWLNYHKKNCLNLPFHSLLLYFM